jgi:hypothetical protein
VDRPGRDGQGVTGMERLRRLAFDLILQRPFEDEDDLFARVGVLDQWRFRANVDARLDDLAPGDAEIVPLQVSAPEFPEPAAPPCLFLLQMCARA